MQTTTISKKQAISLIFDGSPCICIRLDRKDKQVKQILSVFTVSELKEIEAKKIARYNMKEDPYQPILDLKQTIDMFNRKDKYGKILILGKDNIYWAHPEYGHSDYNKTVFAPNTVSNRKKWI